MGSEGIQLKVKLKLLFEKGYRHKEQPFKHEQDYWYSKTACNVYDRGVLYPKISWENEVPYELSNLMLGRGYWEVDR